LQSLRKLYQAVQKLMIPCRRQVETLSDIPFFGPPVLPPGTLEIEYRDRTLVQFPLFHHHEASSEVRLRTGNMRKG